MKPDKPGPRRVRMLTIKALFQITAVPLK